MPETMRMVSSGDVSLKGRCGDSRAARSYGISSVEPGYTDLILGAYLVRKETGCYAACLAERNFGGGTLVVRC